MAGLKPWELGARGRGPPPSLGARDQSTATSPSLGARDQPTSLGRGATPSLGARGQSTSLGRGLPPSLGAGGSHRCHHLCQHRCLQIGLRLHRRVRSSDLHDWRGPPPSRRPNVRLPWSPPWSLRHLPSSRDPCHTRHRALSFRNPSAWHPPLRRRPRKRNAWFLGTRYERHRSANIRKLTRVWESDFNRYYIVVAVTHTI